MNSGSGCKGILELYVHSSLSCPHSVALAHPSSLGTTYFSWHNREQQVYKLAAVAATMGVTGLAVLATYLRFYWQLRDAGVMPWGELVAVLALVGGGVVSSTRISDKGHL